MLFLPASYFNINDSVRYQCCRYNKIIINTLFRSRFSINLLSNSIRDMLILLREPVYKTLLFALSLAYFVMTGIQYWIVEYMIVSFKLQRLKIIGITSLISITAPIIG